VSTLAAEGFGTGSFNNAFDARYTRLRHELRGEILCDDIGVPHIPRALAATMIRERAQALAEQQARIAEQQARFHAQYSADLARTRSMGRPAEPWRSAHEVMLQGEQYEADDSQIAMAFGISTGGTFGPGAEQ
jgi:hypothetical protein